MPVGAAFAVGKGAIAVTVDGPQRSSKSSMVGVHRDFFALEGGRLPVEPLTRVTKEVNHVIAILLGNTPQTSLGRRPRPRTRFRCRWPRRRVRSQLTNQD